MTEPLNEHELAFIQSFIRRERRERFRSQMASPGKRPRFLNRLNHRFADDLDPRFIVPSHDFTARVLKRPKAACRVIASQAEYDGRSVTAAEAIEILREAMFGIVVSFVPGKLACYKDEAPADPIWLVRES